MRTLAELQEPRLEDDGVRAFAFSPDSSLLVVSAVGWWSATVYEAKTFAMRGKHLRHDGIVNAITFSRDGRLLATASDDGTARVFDGQTFAPRGEPLRHHREVTAVVFSSDGSMLATASNDGTARIFDSRTLAVRNVLRHDCAVVAIAFSPDSRRLATASGTRAVIWDVATGAPLSVPPVAGEPQVLLDEWSHKLGLTLDEAWHIVPR